MQHDARQVARALAQRAELLARELLPHGRREGQEWRCGSIAGEAGRSLAVRIHGTKAGLWSDFAGGGGGDALDLVAAVLHRGDRKAALAWACAWLGGETSLASARRAPSAESTPRRTEYNEEGTAGARRIFFSAEADILRTPVAAYLMARGIDLAELPRLPWALRYRFKLWNSELRDHLPAMVAAIAEPNGDITAVHRTWLAQDAAGIWRKARLRDPKKSLGQVTGGFIRIARGASGRPLRDAPEGETVVIAEGIETSLSVAIACPELRVLCAVSLWNMAQVRLPAVVRTIILAADNDGDNPTAMRGLRRAMTALSDAGHAVRVARSTVGKDFNDALLAGAA